jgi:hypothetical protein
LSESFEDLATKLRHDKHYSHADEGCRLQSMTFGTCLITSSKDEAGGNCNEPQNENT